MHDPLPFLSARQLLHSETFLRNLARALVPDTEAADDLVQETWLRALRGTPSRPEALRAWLASTARHLAGKERRGQVRRQRREQAGARPEAVTPTDEIVAKLEVEQRVVNAVLALHEPHRTVILLRYYQDCGPADIAAHLGIPLNTARSRLRRALEELRVALDPAWTRRLRATVAIAGPGAILAPSTPPTFTLGTALGVLGMKSKVALWVLPAVVLGGLAAMLIPFVLSDPEPVTGPRSPFFVGEQATSADVALEEGTRPADAVELPAVRRAAATAAATSPSPTREPVAADRPSLPRPGRVQFAVLDDRTGEPLSDVQVRFVGENRFAELTVTGEAEALLTPDRYHLALSRNGYDPMQRQGIDLATDQVLDLGEIRMSPGCAFIEGQVTAPHLEADQLLAVDLYGAGRRPCPRCVFLPAEPEEDAEDDSSQEGDASEDTDHTDETEPLLVRHEEEDGWSREDGCPECGYSSRFTRLWVRPGGRFAFDNLAGGDYTVRVHSEEHQPIGSVQAAKLESRGRAWLDFRLTATTAASFVLLDEAGKPFQGIRQEDDRMLLEMIHFAVYRGGERVGQASFWPLSTDGSPNRALFQHLRFRTLDVQFAAALRADVLLDYPFMIQTETMVGGPPQEPAPLDRERTPDDGLWASAQAPFFDPAGIEATMGTGYTLQRLPCEELEVQATCGDFSSELVPFHPRPWEDAPLVLIMKEVGDQPPIEEDPGVFRSGTLSLQTTSWIELREGIVLVTRDSDGE